MCSVCFRMLLSTSLNCGTLKNISSLASAINTRCNRQICVITVFCFIARQRLLVSFQEIVKLFFSFTRTKMKLLLVVLLAIPIFVSGQTPDQIRVARDSFRIVAATIDEYLLNPLGIPLVHRIHLALELLFSVNSNVSATTACYGTYQIASYVCNIAGATSGVVSSGSAASTTSTGYYSGTIHFPS